MLAPVVRAAKIAILVNTNCESDSYNGMACQAAVTLAANYPEDQVYTAVVPPPSCLDWLAVSGGGHQVIVFIGFGSEDCSVQAAVSFPTTWVAMLDSCPEGQRPRNLVCGSFVEDQPAYAGGYLAGLVSASKVVGVVGGYPVPAVLKLFNGFAAGLRASCPRCRLEGTYINSFHNPTDAASVATYLVKEMNADIVFGCGGGTGTMAIQKAAELGSLVMGVDTDEFESSFAHYPNEQRARVLSSVTKRVDVATGILVALLRGLAVGSKVEGVDGGLIMFDYTNNAVGLADCHMACGRVEPSSWSSVRAQESRMASRLLRVGLDGFNTPLLPQGAQPNEFSVAPSLARAPPARIHAAIATFSPYLMNYLAVFGGHDASGAVLGDLALYSVESAAWLSGWQAMTAGGPPPPLAKACAAALGNTVVIFGGRTQAGQQSNASYAFTYQPDSLGFVDPTNALVRHEWASLTALGEAPLPVEGPACSALNKSCGLVYGGRALLSEVSSLFVFCLDGGTIRWTRLPQGRQPGPPARESAGIAVVNASGLGLGGGRAVVIAGGLSSGQHVADVWLYALEGEPLWMRLPDLPVSLVAPAVFTAGVPAGSTDALVLVVQPGTPPVDGGFGAFTYDPRGAQWNSQTSAFQPTNGTRPTQATVAIGAGYVWLLGLETGLMAAQFKVQTACPPGSMLVGLTCVPCEKGWSSGTAGSACTACQPGTFAAAGGASACADCQIGRYAADAGHSACPLCPQGRYSDGGGRPCQQCPFGSFGPQVGAGSLAGCTPCAPGRFTGNLTGRTGAADCQACPPGTSLGVPIGQSDCALCAAGLFAGPGQPECTRCPMGRYQAAQGSTACAACDSVLQGGSTAFLGAAAAADCVCDRGSFRDGNGSAACRPCPRGMLCLLGSDLRHYSADAGSPASAPGPYPVLLPGFWSDPSDPLLVFVCENDKICPGGDPGTCSNAATRGLSCASCAAGYYRTKRGCAACGPGDFAPGVVVALLAVACLGSWALHASADGGSERLTIVTAALAAGQLVFCVQALGVMRQLDVVWGQPAAQILEWASVVSLDFEQLKSQCFLGSHSALPVMLLQLFSVPLAALELSLILGFDLWRQWRWYGSAPSLVGYMDRFMNTLGLVLVVVYVSITIAMLRPLHCVAHPNSQHTRSMASDLAILCWRPGEHAALVALGLIGVLCYPVALLAGVAYVTVRQPSLVASGAGHLLFRRCRFIFARFKPECYFWGFFYLLRNLWLPLVPVVCPDSFLGQAVMLSGVLLLSLTAGSYLVPWRTWPANASEAASLLGLVLFMQTAAFLSGAGTNQSANDATVSILLLAVVIGVLGVVVMVLAISLYKHLLPGKQYTFFLCHHKEGAGSLARWFKLQVTACSFATVFLDSDQLEELDLIVDLVRSRTRNLVVLLTRLTLTRMWCAAEITGAAEARVRTVPVACCDFETPGGEAFFEKLGELWSEQQQHSLEAYGITLEKIAGAYKRFFACPTLRLQRFASIGAQQTIVYQLLQAAGVRIMILGRNTTNTMVEEGAIGWAPARSVREVPAEIVILGASGDAEARTTCEVLRHLMQTKVEHRVATAHSRLEAATHAHSVNWLFVLLSRGVLQDVDFEDANMALICGSRPFSMEVVPVLADNNFTFPSEEFYQALEARPELPMHQNSQDYEVDVDWRKFAEHLRGMFNVLALPFSPLASDKLQAEQVLQLARRLRPAVDRLGTTKTSASLDSPRVRSESSTARASNAVVWKLTSSGSRSREPEPEVSMQGEISC